MTRRRVVAVVAGCWALIFASAMGFAGQPRPTQVTTTQRAVIKPEAFAATDPAMKNPQAAKALSATIVSGEFKNTRALDAFAELAKQSGYAIEPYSGGQTRYAAVTATIKNQPFWAAMREVCARGNVGLYYYGDDDPDKILLMPSNYGQQHMMKAAASINGPFLTVLTNLERVNTLDMSEPEKTTRNINIQLYTFAEPKARPTSYSYQPVIDEAVDDNGNSMMPTGPRQEHMQSSRGSRWYGHVSRPYPTTNPGKRIAKLRGHFDAKVQLQSEPVEIADPLKARDVVKTVAGKKITFKSMTSSGSGGGNYIAQIAFHRGENEDPQAFQQNAWNTESVVKVTDAAKGRYQVWAGGGSGGTDEVTKHFQISRRSGSQAAGGSEPNKLVIEVPTATQDVDIPFELVDLPLP